ncbi:MAG: porin [Pseudomonadota bacterium]|nr:porin [Pseudomonadota bacterium]
MKSPCLNIPSSSLRRQLLIASSVLLSLAAQAGTTLPFGDGESISLGLGLRSSFASQSNGAPNGTDRSSDFNLDNLRLYIDASLGQGISATFNTDRRSDGSIQVIDGFGEISFAPGLNVRMGRLLPPGDRQNMDGPFYQLAYDFPGTVSNFYAPSNAVGRDDGVAVWGRVADKKLVYGIGAFQGRNHTSATSTTSNQSANLLYAGRLAYNFLAPEPTPAYYEGSTYFGTAGTILTATVAAMSQSDGVGNSTIKSDYRASNLDLFFELPVAGGGALNLLGAYYKYDYSTAAYTADYSGDNGISPPGKAYLLEGGYLFGNKVGMGRFQPFARYQKYDLDAGGTVKHTDFGVHYVIKGADARLSAFYVKDDQSGTGTTSVSSNAIKLAFQLQF